MRKIASRKDKEKKQRLNQFIIGGVLIFIMFFSVLGYSLQGDEDNSQTEVNKVNYNGFEFVSQNGFWVLELGNFQFVFQNNPEQTELNESVNISSEINPLNYYSGKPLYIFSENDDTKLEIYRNLYPDFNSIVQRMQDACPEDEECTEDVPVKTCEDNFIIIRESEDNKIIQKDNCIFIEGKNENLVKITDEYLFKVLGIK